jgi:ubiquinone/menaquinone biosynthesis C-methylase UbiE
MNFHEPVRANYDRLSRWYDLFSGSEKSVSEAGLRMFDPKPGARILEIGCGTGHALCWLSNAGWRVTGIDLSSGMLSKARMTTNRANLQIDLCQGDALGLPFVESSYNAIFISFTLELFPDEEISGVLSECHRLLRQDGQLGVVSMARENNFAVRLYDWFHVNWPRVIDCRPIYLRAALDRAGYNVQKEQRISMWGLPVDIMIASPA